VAKYLGLLNEYIEYVEARQTANSNGQLSLGIAEKTTKYKRASST
jgi:hypothetical protein